MTPSVDFELARSRMVASQIKPNRVTDPAIVDVMSRIPREVFVPRPQRGFAYLDEDIALGNGRHLMEPMVFARMINALRIRPDEVALDIGCGTGYSTAVLAALANTVVALDSDPEMVRTATENLSDLGIDNAVVIEGDMTGGHVDQSPYPAIILGGAVAEVPAALLDQIGEGGRLVAVVAPEGGLGQVMLFSRVGGSVAHRALFDANTPLLPGFAPEPSFVF